MIQPEAWRNHRHTDNLARIASGEPAHVRLGSQDTGGITFAAFALGGMSLFGALAGLKDYFSGRPPDGFETAAFVLLALMGVGCIWVGLKTGGFYSSLGQRPPGLTVGPDGVTWRKVLPEEEHHLPWDRIAGTYVWCNVSLGEGGGPDYSLRILTGGATSASLVRPGDPYTVSDYGLEYDMRELAELIEAGRVRWG